MDSPSSYQIGGDHYASKSVQPNYRDILDYCPETGVFRWLVTRTSKAPAGSVAGWADKDGYRCITIYGRKIKCHRLAWEWMTGKTIPDGMFVDHINRICDDNRFVNLRLASPVDSAANRSASRASSHGCKGITFTRGKWKASLYRNRSKIFEKYFSTQDEAIAAYEELARNVNGEFYYGGSCESR